MIKRSVFTFYWRPNRDLVAVAVSWLLVVITLYTATVIVGSDVGGGLFYFALYAILGATIFGVGIPLYWMVIVRQRPVADLGLTTRRAVLSLALQLFLAVLLHFGTLAQTQLPPLKQLIPLIALSLAIGFFEAIFWRGWVLLRLEEAFGLIPAVVLGSALYAVYHIGYAMPFDEIAFLFLVGIMYALVFRLTKNVLVIWPVFQPIGQLTTLIKDDLTLPVLSTVGFAEVLIVMFVLVWLAARYHKQHRIKETRRLGHSSGEQRTAS